jgi:GNAT superfamily N-acetyltransferase
VGALVRDGLEVLRTDGPVVLAKRGLTLLGYLEARWWGCALDTPVPDHPCSRSVEELRAGGLREFSLREYVEWRPQLGFDHTRARLAAGARCFLVRVEGRPAASSWLSHGWAYVPYLRRRLVLATGEAYLFDLFTMSEHRRQGLQKLLLARAARCARSRGATSLVALVETHNRPSAAFFAAHGFSPRGRLRCLRLPGGHALVLGANAARPAGSARLELEADAGAKGGG